MFLNIFDESFKRLGVIDVYEDLDFTTNYHSHSLLVATIDASRQNIKHFVNSNELRILTKSTDLSRGYIVDYADFKDGTKTDLMIIAKSLSVMLNWRMIERQQVFTGNIVSVINKFVEPFTMMSQNVKRILPNLVIGSSEFIDINIEAAYTDKPLDESLWDICVKNEISYEILMNHETKKYEFIVYSGKNRSTLQGTNPHIIFAAVFGNVISQSYLDDKSNYKSTAYVAGEGEGVVRKVLIINDEASGFARREVFFDARDLQSKYTNSSDTEVTMSPAEYEALLRERGLNKLADYPHIQTFINETDATSQYIYGRDYFLGDVTTSRNDKLSLITHSRVVVAKENYNKSGYSLKVEFGVAIPTIFERIKKEIKNVSVGSSGGGGGTDVTSVSQLNNDLGFITEEQIKQHVHTQISPSSTWVVSHGLNKYPTVTITDSADNEILGDMRYQGPNSIVVTFGFPITGKLICS
ncbi:siphovirus ReqiPepy6 Gp37-like family protein [Sporosarcina psychrophila]|uniref:Pyridoxine/pyridoxamine 5'-phosphate oxidase n=1 Tax=Sporosarcina psychrophila TaxID=1476 RepID=A0ABV2KCL8_SPOPS